MRKKTVLFGLLIGLLWMFPSAVFCQDYKIGVLANRGAAKAMSDWKATADYLTAKTGKSFAIYPLDYQLIQEMTKEKKIDFFLTNSAMYSELNKLYGAQAIATQINQYKNQPMDKFSSTILAKKDSPIENLNDLKGKDFACASKSAFGGWLMTVRLFLENGIKPEDLKSIRELKTHDNVIYAVFNGAVPAGSVRTGSLEKMVQEGKVKFEDFKVVNRIADDFPLLHSAQLYPEYPMAACQHVPPEIRKEVARLMISIPEKDPALTSAKIAGWKEPLDYQSVVECLAAIKHGAFANVALATPAATEKPAVSAPAQPPSSAAQVKPQARIPRVRQQAPAVQ
ncbi:MAG: phosphate/phosphite/phosphonate ABC transporter substrate-binding protein [Syntrophobacteraceae bacterium]